jgi:tetratricopeptide (TPR) repeat protein
MSTPRCSRLRAVTPRLLPLTLCLGVLLCARLGGAAETPASDESPESKEAYEHYLRAYRLASNSSYEEALGELQQALEKGAPKEVPRRYPDYLFATAKIYQRLNRHIEAVAYYERYLKLAGPEDGNRNKAESELESERAKLLPLVGQPTLAASLSPAVLPGGEASAERGGAAARPVDTGPFYKKWWFFAAVGGGVATLITVSVLAAQPWLPKYENPVVVEF